MKMRRLVLSAAFALALSLVPASAQQDFSKVQITAKKIAGSVYMLEGSGGNIGVSVGDDGVIIVDDQFAPLAPKIKAALKDITAKPLRYVLNTHYHFDHTGGNEIFGADALIVAHDNVRKRLEAGSMAAGQRTPPAPKTALPVITFNDRASVHLNGEEIRAIHIPNGHTDGDSIIWFTKSNVVHMGDDFVTYGFPFVDADNGGSVGGMIAGIAKTLSMVPQDVKIIPGHGPLSTTEDLRKFMDMMRETRQLVSDAAKQGKTAAQMKSAKILAKYDHLGKGFIKTDSWIDLLYKEVTQTKTGMLRYQNHGHANELRR